MEIHELTKKIEKVKESYVKEFGFTVDSDWYLMKTQEELGELTQHYLMMTGRARTKGFSPAELKVQFEMEVADVICMMLLLAHHHKVDLDKAIQKKWLDRLKE